MWWRTHLLLALKKKFSLYTGTSIPHCMETKQNLKNMCPKSLLACLLDKEEV
jgi:hypothetical protein